MAYLWGSIDSVWITYGLPIEFIMNFIDFPKEFIDFPKELLYICYTSWGKGETEKTKANRENQGKQRKTKEFA